MTKKIDGVTYPDGVITMLQSKTIGPAFRDYLDSVQATESYKFLQNENASIPNMLYTMYLHETAPYHINISSALRNKAKGLADKSDWENKDWPGIYKAAMVAIESMIKQDHIDKFFRSEHFHKRHAVLKRGMAARLHAMLKDRTTKQAATVNVRVDKKRLILCGYRFGQDRSQDSKAIEMTKRLIDSHLAGDGDAAKRHLDFILDIQPDDSLIPERLPELIKQFQRFGVLPKAAAT
ncbi:hypothetical protein [Rhizobium halophytocola]|uniref:RGS domain-containing protein n=1 Tax=Rhizobium halophytocola TaxID=735519 RepID=A0ABS4E5N6_9HYPH|nr:hypothetical protein [Rhizobium halophytocola]MBP1853255.1 hypothetical protein [Rhizobium halophytocola]